MNLLARLLSRVIASGTGQIIVGSLLAANKILCFRLLWMAKKDQQERQAFLNGRPWDEGVDSRNTLTMKKMVARYGWPGEGRVGQLGAQAAWLLVQHADHDLEFQKHCHRLLEAAVKNGDAQAQHLAYLTDRICLGDGVPQIYGTQWDHPIADPDHVDERRAAVGLSSLAEYIQSSKHMREQVRKRTDI